MKRKQSRREFTRKLALVSAGIPLASAAIPLVGQHREVTLRDIGKVSSPGSGPKPFGIHLFSKHLQFLDYPEMARVCRESGLDGVDLTVRPGGHVLPENVEKDMPRAAEAIRKEGLELTMMTSRINNPDDPLTERVLKTASGLGVKYYRLGYFNYEKDKSIHKNLQNFKSRMEGLAELNEKYGIHGAYQNHAGARFGGPVWDIWNVIHDMDPQWTGCQYDIRHAVVEGAQSWPLGLKALKSHIRCLVIKDFYWNLEDGRWRIKNTPIGKGMVDFKMFFDQVSELQISGPISMHIEYPMFPDRNIPPGQKKDLATRIIGADVESLRKLIPG